MEPMTTISEVLNKLTADGYTVDLNLKNDETIYHGNILLKDPDAFVIDKHYRFEGVSDPEDEAVVYAISSAKYNIKGVLVNGYGPSSDSLTDQMIGVLKEKHL